jgi:hypothetical protein
MIIIFLLAAVFLAVAFTCVLFASGNKTELEQEAEDIEQSEYLKEYNKKQGGKKNV